MKIESTATAPFCFEEFCDLYGLTLTVSQSIADSGARAFTVGIKNCTTKIDYDKDSDLMKTMERYARACGGKKLSFSDRSAILAPFFRFDPSNELRVFCRNIMGDDHA